MVVMLALPTEETGVMHDRRASPSMRTVQAPHWALPHPNLVPLRSSPSRSAQRSGMSSGASTVRTCPFTLSLNFKWRPSAGEANPAILLLRRYSRLASQCSERASHLGRAADRRQATAQALCGFNDSLLHDNERASLFRFRIALDDRLTWLTGEPGTVARPLPPPYRSIEGV